MASTRALPSAVSETSSERRSVRAGPVVKVEISIDSAISAPPA